MKTYKEFLNESKLSKDLALEIETIIKKYYNDVNIFDVKDPTKINTKTFDNYLSDINWSWLTTNERFSAEFLEKYKEYIDWDAVSKNYLHLTKDVLIKFKDRLNHTEILRRFTLDSETKQIFSNNK